jgi:hypothetical protein
MTDGRHIDGNKRNNSIHNLKWGTRADNEDDKKRHGRDNAGERHGMSTVTDAQVGEIVKRYVAGDRVADIAADYGISRDYPAKLLRQRGSALVSDPDAIVAARHQHGQSHCRSKLTDAQALELLRRYKAGESPTVLAREYGVGHSYPAALAKGARYLPGREDVL